MHIQSGKAADFLQHGLSEADHAAYAQAEDMLWVMLEDLIKPDDRPEIWAAFPQFLSALPMFSRVVRNSHAKAASGGVKLELHVLERATHQCCASWLDKSAGDLNTSDWEQVWNSESAQAVRASIHDGSYRHCNKMACPAIQSGSLPTKEAAATHWPTLASLITNV
nr:SPASM domain-containing protein [uncultured Sphingomonas sp.]